MVTGNTHFSIAVHVLTALSFYDRPATSDRLASSVSTNPAFLRSILSRLRQAGLIETKLGKGGGSTLARPANEISLLDIYRATEGSAKVQEHCCQGVDCIIAKQIPVVLSKVNAELDAAMAAVLRSKTLSDIAADVVAQAS